MRKKEEWRRNTKKTDWDWERDNEFKLVSLDSIPFNSQLDLLLLGIKKKKRKKKETEIT